MLDTAFFLAHAWEFLALGCLLVASGFFSGTETALFNLSRSQLQQLSGRPGLFARLVCRLTKRPRQLLNALLLGNTLVNVAFSATAAVLVLEFQQTGAPAWAVTVMSLAGLLVVILFGEVMPKMLAYAAAMRWSLLAAMPVYVLQRILMPVIWLLDWGLIWPLSKIIVPRTPKPNDISAAELTALTKLSASRGIIDHDTSDMMREIVELTDVRVADVMIPRVDMIAFDLADGNEAMLKLLRETRLRKIPVYRNDLDNILGVIHAKRLLLNPTGSLEEMTQPIAFMPEAANLEKVLLQFRVTRKQLAIVVDEYGGTAGLTTLKDVMREIVGDIPNTRQPESPPPVKQLGPREYLLDGDLAIHDWAEAFDIELPHGRISTLGGFVTALLERIPKKGDTVAYRNLRFTVRAMQGRRVGTIYLQLAEGES
ncbi:MAG: hemolysin family protein [Phycisphaerae bacterium]|nr:hemolysin family protein [Phycisphaerae bacterium]